MNTKQAAHVLKSLVEGIDPETGAELEGNPILHNAHVLRALLAALVALELKATRDARKSLLPVNVGNRWTAAEETTLADAFRSDDSVADMAQRLGRSARAIEARLVKLG